MNEKEKRFFEMFKLIWSTYDYDPVFDEFDEEFFMLHKELDIWNCYECGGTGFIAVESIFEGYKVCNECGGHGMKNLMDELDGKIREYMKGSDKHVNR